MNSNSILAGSIDGTVRTYDLRAGQLYSDTVLDAVTCVRLSEDEKTYLCTCLGGIDTLMISLSIFIANIHFLLSWIYIMCSGSLVLVDRAKGKILQTYKGHRHESYKIEATFDNDCKHVICATETGSIMHWDLLTAKMTLETNGAHDKCCSSIVMHPSLPLFFTSSYDGTVKCWKKE